MTEAERRVLAIARVWAASQGGTRITVIRARLALLEAVRRMLAEEREERE